MKLLKRKNFQSLIYAIFISLPIMSILPSTIYFAFNHEASNYTHDEVVETYEFATNEVNSVDDLVVGNIYKFSGTNVEPSIIEGAHLDNYFESQIIGECEIYLTSVVEIDPDDYYIYNQCYLNIYENDYIHISYSDLDIICDEINVEYMYLVINGYSLQEINEQSFIQYFTASDYLGEKYVEVVESEMNPLTAFDTAIDKFVSDNDFGNIDFFTFFSSLFLSSTSMNNLYIHFINWYLNYILYISLAYLLFSVLLWFVNFGRRLLEDSQNINVGGF